MNIASVLVKEEPAASNGDFNDLPSDDDLPLAALGGINGTPTSNGVKREAADMDDDDIPLAKLHKTTETKFTRIKREGEEKVVETKVVKEVKVKKERSSKEVKDKEKKSSKEKKEKEKPKKASITEQRSRTENLYSTRKGQLVQSLLVRWNYAIEWPPKESLEVPPNAMPLDGFPGAFIYVKGDNIGQVWDRRPHENKPCFNNYYRRPASELKGLVLKAIKAQMKALAEVEGPDVPLMKALKLEMNAIEAINTEKAEKEAIKLRKHWEPYGV